MGPASEGTAREMCPTPSGRPDPMLGTGNEADWRVAFVKEKSGASGFLFETKMTLRSMSCGVLSVGSLPYDYCVDRHQHTSSAVCSVQNLWVVGRYLLSWT